LALLIGLWFPVALAGGFVAVIARPARFNRPGARERAARTEAEAYVVDVLDDDHTPMKLVISALEGVFGMARSEAISTMLLIHESGRAACAGFESEADAKAKADELQAIARKQGFELRCETRPGSIPRATAQP